MITPSFESNTGRELSDDFSDEDDDIYLTIESLHQSGPSPVEKSDKLQKNESIQKKNQSLIDPILVKDSSLIAPKSEFLSASISSSATSSPRFSPNFKRKNKSRNQNVESPNYYELKLRQESNSDRGKSPDEFDIALGQNKGPKHEISKIEGENVDKLDEEFKCGSLCLYLPGFGKGKPVRPNRKEGVPEKHTMISRRVSLERFECESRSSSAIINDREVDGDSKNLFFDLPMELIQTSGNDAHLPVTAGFVFDNGRKGMLNYDGGTRVTAAG